MYSQYKYNETFGIQAPDDMTIISWPRNSNPHVPKINPNYVFRKNFLRDGLAYLKQPAGDALYIVGPTGSGKTTGVTEMAGRLNWPVMEYTAHDQMEAAELIGQFLMASKAPGESPSMSFAYGPLPIAMKYGYILLLNELDTANPGQISALNDVLEGRPLVIAENGGEVIHPHEMFRVIVTGNSNGAGDASGLYQGVQQQNLAAMDRYRMTELGYADPEDEKRILEGVVPKLPEVIREGMVRLANEVRNLFIGSDNADASLSLTFSTRTLVRWSRLALTFRGAPNVMEYSLNQALLLRAKPEEKEAIIEIAKSIFGDQWS